MRGFACSKEERVARADGVGRRVFVLGVAVHSLFRRWKLAGRWWSGETKREKQRAREKGKKTLGDSWRGPGFCISRRVIAVACYSLNSPSPSLNYILPLDETQKKNSRLNFFIRYFILESSNFLVCDEFLAFLFLTWIHTAPFVEFRNGFIFPYGIICFCHYAEVMNFRVYISINEASKIL